MEAVRALRAAGVRNVELSGGLLAGDPLAGLVEEVAHGPMQVHNYFPPQRDPFVFNLCDPDPAGRERSLLLACRAIEFGIELGSYIYSFHAGFLGTPAVSDLGRTWGVTNRIDADQAMEFFAQSVDHLAVFAADRGVSLMVENNVLTVGTAQSNGSDILLMTTPSGIREVLASLPPGVRLLMDVGHLAVSAATLGFDAGQGLADVADLVGGYHLNDNDGTADTNEPLHADSWFWDGLAPGVEFVTLELNPSLVESFSDQVALTETRLAAHAV